MSTFEQSTLGNISSFDLRLRELLLGLVHDLPQRRRSLKLCAERQKKQDNFDTLQTWPALHFACEDAAESDGMVLNLSADF